MRSSSGEHFIALDHIRALAAFLVFAWHFIHSTNGYPVPFDFVPSIFIFSIIDEGHTGVAIFLTLSGYLFAKILNNKTINFKAFLFNRLLRLLPMLFLVIIILGLQKYISGANVLSYAHSILLGFFAPTLLPNGWWSIALEFHYYMILPILIQLFRQSKIIPILLIPTAILFRIFIYYFKGKVHYIAYYTILGRIDQFVLGMLVFQFRSYFSDRHIFAILTFISLSLFYFYFNTIGGYYQNLSGQSESKLWIFIPTIEALAYSFIIAWYDNSFFLSKAGASGFFGLIGEYSYSIYLLHFFVVFDVARFINERIMNISNFYLALIWTVPSFLLLIIPGYLCFRFIEAPLLKHRKNYVVN